MNKFAVVLVSVQSNVSDIFQELDVDPQRDDDASPMSSYRCMLRPIFEFEFRTFLKKKKIKFLGSHAVVLVKTFPLMYQ